MSWNVHQFMCRNFLPVLAQGLKGPKKKESLFLTAKFILYRMRQKCQMLFLWIQFSQLLDPIGHSWFARLSHSISYLCPEKRTQCVYFHFIINLNLTRPDLAWGTRRILLTMLFAPIGTSLSGDKSLSNDKSHSGDL